MAYDADTGNGATITFGGTGFSAQFEEIDAGEKTIDDIEDSYLGTTGNKTFMPADLVDPGELKGTVQFNSGAAEVALKTVETVTVTFPLRSGQTTPATLAGTGYIKKWKRPTLQNNQKMMGEITFKWNGKTGPTFTAGS